MLILKADPIYIILIQILCGKIPKNTKTHETIIVMGDYDAKTGSKIRLALEEDKPQ